eukprot:m.62591 g.62591  ORF g.62591 m.62591 type:complete len:377 (+) comp7144_c0_seq2:62-1192(+)
MEASLCSAQGQHAVLLQEAAEGHHRSQGSGRIRDAVLLARLGWGADVHGDLARGSNAQDGDHSITAPRGGQAHAPTGESAPHPVRAALDPAHVIACPDCSCIWNGVDRGRVPRIFYIACESEIDTDAWFRALSSAVTRYRESPEGKETHARLLEQNLEWAGYDSRQVRQSVRAQVFGEGLRRSDKGETAMSHLYARQSVSQSNTDLVASVERLRLAKQARAATAPGSLEEDCDDTPAEADRTASASQGVPDSGTTSATAITLTGSAALLPSEQPVSAQISLDPSPEPSTRHGTVSTAAASSCRDKEMGKDEAVPQVENALSHKEEKEESQEVTHYASLVGPADGLRTTQEGAPPAICMQTFRVVLDDDDCAGDSEL